MQLGYTEIGILLCDKDKYKIIDSEKPLEIRKEVTKTMLERMLKVLSVKCKSITKSVAFNRYDTNPKKAFEKLNLGFSQSFADCRTNQADINIDN